jgi:nitrogenase molybdenum-cofactor synthesis protein NifE
MKTNREKTPDTVSHLQHDSNTDEKNSGSAADSEDKNIIAGIWGFSPLDFAGIISAESLRRSVASMGYGEMICCGAGTDTESLKKIGEAEKNFVLSPAGAAAAKWLEERYGTPWEYWIPDAERILNRFDGGFFSSGAQTLSGKRVLIIHQQVLADAIRQSLKGRGMLADTAGFFLMNRDILQPGDVSLREETDVRQMVTDRKYDYVICDKALEPILSGMPATLIHLPHFAVSGDLNQD